MKQILAISHKEFLHILRDWQSLSLIVALPIVMLLLFGFALSADLKNAPISVQCPDLDPYALEISRGITQNGIFVLSNIQMTYMDPIEVFAQSPRPKAIVRFPARFAQCVQRANCAVQILVDGSDPNTATLVNQNLSLALLDQAQRVFGIRSPPLMVLQARFLYNPEQKSSLYFVPGLMSTLLIMVCALLTSVALVREKERGTLDQLRVSPLSSINIILGKLIPYFAIASAIAGMILLLGELVFDLQIKGGLLLLFLSVVVYICTSLAIGLLISTVVQKQQQAMLIALAGTLLPSVILSGFVFPIASMPLFLQILTKVIPATWFLQIVRGLVLQGTGWAELGQSISILAGMGLLLLTIATLRLRRQL